MIKKEGKKNLKKRLIAQPVAQTFCQQNHKDKL